MYREAPPLRGPGLTSWRWRVRRADSLGACRRWRRFGTGQNPGLVWPMQWRVATGNPRADPVSESQTSATRHMPLATVQRKPGRSPVGRPPADSAPAPAGLNTGKSNSPVLQSPLIPRFRFRFPARAPSGQGVTGRPRLDPTTGCRHSSRRVSRTPGRSREGWDRLLWACRVWGARRSHP